MTRGMILLLVVHGLLLVLVGMALGFPLQRAITSADTEQAQLAWRSSHTTLVTGGTLYIAVGAAGQLLVLGVRAARLATWTLVSASYLFAVVLCAGPWIGARGLTAVGPPSHVAVHIGFLCAIVLLFAGFAVVAWGACAALREGGRA
ncbi:MAG: hypothetical protein SGI72_00475 [Planctomycetota bacterium]|nr:hypothetical protein [Planctomycetota bacterium]